MIQNSGTLGAMVIDTFKNLETNINLPCDYHGYFLLLKDVDLRRNLHQLYKFVSFHP